MTEIAQRGNYLAVSWLFSLASGDSSHFYGIKVLFPAPLLCHQCPILSRFSHLKPTCLWLAFPRSSEANVVSVPLADPPCPPWVHSWLPRLSLTGLSRFVYHRKIYKISSQDFVPFQSEKYLKISSAFIGVLDLGKAGLEATYWPLDAFCLVPIILGTVSNCRWPGGSRLSLSLLNKCQCWGRKRKFTWLSITHYTSSNRRCNFLCIHWGRLT